MSRWLEPKKPEEITDQLNPEHFMLCQRMVIAATLRNSFASKKAARKRHI